MREGTHPPAHHGHRQAQPTATTATNQQPTARKGHRRKENDINQRTHTATKANQTARETDRATLPEWAYRVATHPAIYTDPELLTCTEGRIARFEAGTYLQEDVQGLLD